MRDTRELSLALLEVAAKHSDAPTEGQQHGGEAHDRQGNMGFKTIQPDGKCETCRNSKLGYSGDGWNEPRMQELECRVGDALESLEELHFQVAEKMGYEPYGAEYGSSDPCPFYRALPPCTSHPEHLSGQCPKCEVVAAEAEAKALEGENE